MDGPLVTGLSVGIPIVGLIGVILNFTRSVGKWQGSSDEQQKGTRDLLKAQQERMRILEDRHEQYVRDQRLICSNQKDSCARLIAAMNLRQDKADKR